MPNSSRNFKKKAIASFLTKLLKLSKFQQPSEANKAARGITAPLLEKALSSAAELTSTALTTTQPLTAHRLQWGFSAWKTSPEVWQTQSQ